VEFKARRGGIELALVQGVDKVISQIMNCKNFKSYSDKIFINLRAYELWPMAEKLQRDSIRMVFDQIVMKTLPSSSFTPCFSLTCMCDSGKLRVALLKAKELASGTEGGLCLDCVKRGTKPSKEAVCRFCII
jgi:hypothetical protein